jgi:hypothetical protein
MHVSCIDAADLVGPPAHCQINILTPTPTISSSTHPDNDLWYNNNDPTFTWTEGADSPWVSGHYYLLNQQPSTPMDQTNTWTTLSTASFSNVADGIWYFHLRAKGVNGCVGSTSHYRIQIYTGSPPTSPVITPNIPVDTLTNVQPSFTWTITADISGIAGYSYLLDSTPTTDPGTTVQITLNQKTYTGVSSGVWYFHVRAKNNAGLWGSASHAGPFIIDSDLPTQPDVSSPTHTPGIWSLNPDIALTWTAASDATSEIVGYRYILNHETSTNPSSGTLISGTSESFPNTADGIWYFHISAVDGAGNMGNPVHFGPINIDPTPASSRVCSFATPTTNSVTFNVV